VALRRSTYEGWVARASERDTDLIARNGELEKGEDGPLWGGLLPFAEARAKGEVA
jgi:hypothetical protein